MVELHCLGIVQEGAKLGTRIKGPVTLVKKVDHYRFGGKNDYSKAA